MHLVSATVGPFKSVNEPQKVPIEPDITVLVGMNEAGKTVFLQALEKSADAVGIAKFEPVEDYPRKDLPGYLRDHKTKPARATSLRYRLTKDEVDAVNRELGTALSAGFEFSVDVTYANSRTIGIEVDERPVVAALAAKSALSTDAAALVAKAVTLREIPGTLTDASLADQDKAFLAAVTARVAKTQWNAVVAWEAWQVLEKRIPKFLYFGEYDLLPSKTNLADLASRVEQAKSNPRVLSAENRAVLALLRMADVAVKDFNEPAGYETLKAKIEGVSISLTDQIMAFWKQNEDLEVEIDIKADPSDAAPYNNGPNLYLRIKNRRHRGVSTPFRQRSRGFIWFFSFLVWFDSVQQQLDQAGERHAGDLILLLDEPGLSLHALAQQDFLRYIDDLATRHQVLYTTHSPFLVHMDRLKQVRVVEDKVPVGTTIREDVTDSNERTVFPLQAALGWTVAQSLFIAERNLLVEGPSDLLYLKAVSSLLDGGGKAGLRDEITIVPAGGLDKVVTFVALLGANGLKLAVLHDYRGSPEQKLIDLVRQKMISSKAILDASMYRAVGKSKQPVQRPTDVEDLFPIEMYLGYFNAAFGKQLKAPVTEKDLPKGDRIIDRLERWLLAEAIALRPSGGFNHYSVAVQFASAPPSSLDGDTIRRFEALFGDVNKLLMA